MLKRNDGMTDNAVQNRFTAMLKVAVRNKKIDYIRKTFPIKEKELSMEVSTYQFGEESETIRAIMDYDLLRKALKSLSERERNIIVAHLIEDRDFADIGRQFGLSYKGAAAVFYRSIRKLREELGRYYDDV